MGFKTGGSSVTAGMIDRLTFKASGNILIGDGSEVNWSSSDNGDGTAVKQTLKVIPSTGNWDLGFSNYWRTSTSATLELPTLNGSSTLQPGYSGLLWVRVELTTFASAILWPEGEVPDSIPADSIVPYATFKNSAGAVVFCMGQPTPAFA